MRVLLAPDSFSGTLTAVEAAHAMAAGWQRVRPTDVLQLLPMSDGGLGLLEAVAHAVPAAEWHTAEVADAAGIATTARWLGLPDGTAVVETAEAIGLHALPADRRDPLRTTSYGVGQLLLAVSARNPSRILIGLGGSATVEGGAGMISALTAHGLRRADGNGLKVGGRWVGEVASCTGVLTAELPAVQIAADVTSPLLGPSGAARVFGPQKGASAADVAELEANLTKLADVIERDLHGGPWRDLPGAGAAGGLGFALAALLGGGILGGAELVARIIGLDHALRTDEHGEGVLVVTGEGRLDSQSAAGKVPGHVRDAARAGGHLVMAIAGSVHDGAGAAFDDVVALGPDGLGDPATSLTAAAATLATRLPS